MGILSRIFRSRDAPKNATAGSGYSFMLGTATSGKAVNERSSMQITAVYSCVRILSEAIASLPLHLYKYTDTGTAKATEHLLYFLLHDEPNTEMTSFVFRETLMTHLLLWGNAYAQIIRNGKGEVLALYPLMPDRMNVDRDESGNIVYEYMVSQEDVSVTALLLWQRTLSAWLLPQRNTEVSFLQTVLLQAEYLNSPERSRNLKESVKVGIKALEEKTIIRLRYLKKGSDIHLFQFLLMKHNSLKRENFR